MEPTPATQPTIDLPHRGDSTVPPQVPALLGTDPPIYGTDQEKEAWAIVNRRAMKGRQIDWKSWKERTPVVQWCLSHADLYLTGPRNKWENQLRIFMNIRCRKDHSQPTKLLGKGGRWIVEMERILLGEELETGVEPDGGEYKDSLEQWMRILDQKEEVSKRKTAEDAEVATKKERAKAVQELLKANLLKSITDGRPQTLKRTRQSSVETTSQWDEDEDRSSIDLDAEADEDEIVTSPNQSGAENLVTPSVERAVTAFVAPTSSNAVILSSTPRVSSSSSPAPRNGRGGSRRGKPRRRTQMDNLTDSLGASFERISSSIDRLADARSIPTTTAATGIVVDERLTRLEEGQKELLGEIKGLVQLFKEGQ
ncbi:hypothetical protein LTR10_024459 [Elasticomyces elasticus]|uniref:Uncharacterized protein n=1 Tax=Exophiala sideris TaxID=1016849 RepID=A0ABR0ITZ8_9EURO|nr:hypothetical protein LTR10_024459 [Elasticomyces elasticus]KAK5020612.1 hypothetical protein LTS07_011511 [Exophiala sideris]KAK5175932.1 hypothetical protein LTR44_011508 [Eurotiomycetes sp. CCFEE 6388]KAK5004639.1 hypothetical protein LTR28_008646 [Elasticomyces elasticus]KAK5022246.1 hypothetical protein LTR13_011474 [Exophiala sideris]